MIFVGVISELILRYFKVGKATREIELPVSKNNEHITPFTGTSNSGASSREFAQEFALKHASAVSLQNSITGAGSEEILGNLLGSEPSCP